MTEYVPDNWVLFQIPHKGEIYFKVLGGWGSSYLEGESWRMNSGISRYEETDTEYLFYGYSGSVYKCRKNGEALRHVMKPTHDKMIEGGAKAVSVEEFKKHVAEVGLPV